MYGQSTESEEVRVCAAKTRAAASASFTSVSALKTRAVAIVEIGSFFAYILAGLDSFYPRASMSEIFLSAALSSILSQRRDFVCCYYLNKHVKTQSRQT